LIRAIHVKIPEAHIKVLLLSPAMGKIWFVTIIAFDDDAGKIYTVRRRIPEMSIAESQIFDDINKAMRLFNEWLKQ
jgi:hypothetical protein